MGADFTAAEIAAAGRHCIHGYWVNESTVTFYADDAAALATHLKKFKRGKDVRPAWKTMRLIIHADSSQASSPWDDKPRNMPADWRMMTWQDGDSNGKTPAPWHCQVDVWLGGRVKLDALKIPDDFEVASGGEIEKSIEARKRKTEGANP